MQTDLVGEWQLDIDRGYQRTWDVDETESTVIRLIDDHALSVADVSGLIKTTRSVDGNIAKRLLERLDGEALVELRRCFKWEQKGRARVKVTAPPQLTE
jgi:hypothetical protein